MKFSPKYKTKKLGMIYTPLWEVFCSFLNWEGADIRPQIGPRKIPDINDIIYTCVQSGLILVKTFKFDETIPLTA